MTCASAPAKPDDATLMLFNIRVPQLNWHYAVLSAASVAMVIGLIQQTMQLVRRTSAIHSTDANDRFAISFATAWRIAITATIGICLLLQLLLSREVITRRKMSCSLRPT